VSLKKSAFANKTSGEFHLLVLETILDDLIVHKVVPIMYEQASHRHARRLQEVEKIGKTPGVMTDLLECLLMEKLTESSPEQLVHQ
jgi:hypothetical protein